MKGALTAIAIGVALILIYVGSCCFWPFRACTCCHGSGRHERGDGKVFKVCGWCSGSGRRMRFGRRVWNAARRRRLGAQ
jgi:hypothetical protein